MGFADTCILEAYLYMDIICISYLDLVSIYNEVEKNKEDPDRPGS